MKAMRWIGGSFSAIGVRLLCFHIRLCNLVLGWCSRERLWNAGSQLHCCHWGWRKDEGVSLQVCSSTCVHQLCYNVSPPTPLALCLQCLPNNKHLTWKLNWAWIWQARQQAAGLLRWPHCCSCYGRHPWHEWLLSMRLQGLFKIVALTSVYYASLVWKSLFCRGLAFRNRFVFKVENKDQK